MVVLLARKMAAQLAMQSAFLSVDALAECWVDAMALSSGKPRVVEMAVWWACPEVDWMVAS